MPEMSYEEIEAVLREKGSVLFYSTGLVEARDPYYECSLPEALASPVPGSLSAYAEA
jgi:hypothetical protein